MEGGKIAFTSREFKEQPSTTSESKYASPRNGKSILANQIERDNFLSIENLLNKSIAHQVVTNHEVTIMAYTCEAFRYFGIGLFPDLIKKRKPRKSSTR